MTIPIAADMRDGLVSQNPVSGRQHSLNVSLGFPGVDVVASLRPMA
jgi:hypothetical protein